MCVCVCVCVCLCVCVRARVGATHEKISLPSISKEIPDRESAKNILSFA